MPLEVLIDTSINSTLSRTILTSVTTMIAIAALVLFGGEVIRGFTISMRSRRGRHFSSIYIAAPILILFKLRSDTFDKKDEKDRRPAKRRRCKAWPKASSSASSIFRDGRRSTLTGMAASVSRI